MIRAVHRGVAPGAAFLAALALAGCNPGAGAGGDFARARGPLPAGVEIPAGFSRADVVEQEDCYYVLEAGAYTQIGCAQ